MKLVFIHGPVASGKLTIAKELGRMTGYAVFHNHLVVDAVAAVFPFGTEQFVRLREKMWLDVMREAAMAKRSLIFTFAPEPTVVEGFDRRVVESVSAAGGSTHFVQLTVPAVVQEERLTAPSRAAFGKLQSVDVLRELRTQFEASERAMPKGEIVMIPPLSALQRPRARLPKHWVCHFPRDRWRLRQSCAFAGLGESLWCSGRQPRLRCEPFLSPTPPSQSNPNSAPRPREVSQRAGALVPMVASGDHDRIFGVVGLRDDELAGVAVCLAVAEASGSVSRKPL